MSDIIELLNEIKFNLDDLSEQLEGAAYMLNENSPHREFLKYLKRCLCDMHDKIAWNLKFNKEKNPKLDLSTPNCS